MSHETQEMRAYGLFLSDLLARIDACDNESPASTALEGVRAACLNSAPQVLPRACAFGRMPATATQFLRCAHWCAETRIHAHRTILAKHLGTFHTAIKIACIMQCSRNARCMAVQVQSAGGPGVLASPHPSL